MRTTLLLCFLLIYFSKVSAQEHSYVLDNLMGQSLSNPSDFTVASNGDIYVVDNFSIKVFNKAEYASGKFVREILIDHDFVGHSIAVDNEGHFYIVRSDHKIHKYTLQGEYVMSFGGKGQQPGFFDSPRDIALDSHGNIYVADTYNHRIQKFDRNGRLLQIIGGSGTGHGILNEPSQIKIDADNKINVIEKHRFQRFLPDGTTDLEIKHPDLNDLAIDQEGNLFIAFGPMYYINKYTSDGHLLETLFNRGKGEHEINTLKTRLHIDQQGFFYLLEIDNSTRNNRIQKFDSTFFWLISYGKHYADNATYLDLNRSRVAFDATGNFYTTNENSTDSTLHWVQLFDYNGVWRESFDIPGELNSSTIVHDITIDNQGAVYILANLERGIIHKYTAVGKYLSSIRALPESVRHTFSPKRLFFDQSNYMYLTDGRRYLKFNSVGNLVTDVTLDNLTQHAITDVALGFDGNFYLIQGASVKKYNQQGKLLLQFNALSSDAFTWEAPAALAVDASGAIYVADRLTIRKYDQQGKILSTINGSRSDTGTTIGAELSVSPDGSSIRLTLKDDYHFFNTIRFYTNHSLKPSNSITGTIFSDANENCEKDSDEQGLEGILVMAAPGPYFTKTDRSGSYKLELGVGTYTVSQIFPDRGKGQALKQICPTEGVNASVTFDINKNLTAKVDFANHVTLSPYLSVNVSSTRRRRCFESTTTVKYSNIGFATAPDARVYLQLPTEVELLSADKPYTRLPDGTYEFSVGDLAANQSGTITIQDIVTCGDESVRGLTVCTRAWITPSNNKPTEPTPTISISGRCNAETGMIRFVVRNTGTADMNEPGHYRKYADGQLASVEQYRLAAGDSMVLWVPTMGYTWRIEADQPNGNGDNTAVSLTIEGCTDGISVPSTGQVNLLPTDDEEAEKSVECMLITDSYDPNDKLVTPVGRTEELYTPTNTALKYKIRFQNTGTDVAYRVVVVDTLSEHLDLSTLQLGASSHPSRVEISGKGRPVLTWTFDNIMLPDSTTNEPGSHGYIQFSIKPKADLPEKTLVENFADIFFDFNSPIRTNITQNRIYDMPPVIVEKVRVKLEDVLATPGIADFTPAAGKFGAEVTITGQRFAKVATNNKVLFNGKAATVVSATATELKVLVPTGSTSGNIKVITPDGAVTATAKFQVYQPPVLTSFSPIEGIVGQTVTLNGEHLQPELIESIKLGALTCEIVSSNSNTITVRVPDHAVTGKFQVSTKGGETTSSSAYTVWYAPGITGISKESGIVGAIVEIRGENFATDKMRNNVRFGQALAEVLEASTQQLTVRVPEGAESGFISLETPGGKASATTVFEVIPGPRFTSMQPASGAVGMVVEITGEHFGVMDQLDKIDFNGQEALVLEQEGNRYKVRVPRGATTGKVTITGYGGKARSTADFVVEELSPAEAISVYPNPNKGAFTISLRHADFDVQQIEVYDALGKRLHQTNINGPRPEMIEIKLQAAQAGLYFLQIQTARGLITKKLTVH